MITQSKFVNTKPYKKCRLTQLRTPALLAAVIGISVTVCGCFSSCYSPERRRLFGWWCKKKSYQEELTETPLLTRGQNRSTSRPMTPMDKLSSESSSDSRYVQRECPHFTPKKLTKEICNHEFGDTIVTYSWKEEEAMKYDDLVNEKDAVARQFFSNKYTHSQLKKPITQDHLKQLFLHDSIVEMTRSMHDIHRFVIAVPTEEVREGKIKAQLFFRSNGMSAKNTRAGGNITHSLPNTFFPIESNLLTYKRGSSRWDQCSAMINKSHMELKLDLFSAVQKMIREKEGEDSCKIKRVEVLFAKCGSWQGAQISSCLGGVWEQPEFEYYKKFVQGHDWDGTSKCFEKRVKALESAPKDMIDCLDLWRDARAEYLDEDYYTG